MPLELRVGGNTQHYIYDVENRLVRATRPGEGGFTARYHYDAFGRRVSKEVERPVHGRLGEVETTRINFTWQGMRLLQERHNNNNLGYTYVYSPDADYTPIAQVKQWLELEGVDDELFYYHTDLNGAPLDMTNEEGRIVWSGDYAPWGKVINQTQTFLLHHGSAQLDIWQPLRYAGQYEDEETGLHQNLHRFYAPEVGRYIQPDPIGLAGGLNLYSYGPNPANWVDPLGLCGKRGGLTGDQRRARIDKLAEANAHRRLQEMEHANLGSHFLERHGAQTSLESQLGRASSGINPTTGIQQRIPSAATRFTSHRDQLNSIQRAQTIFNQTGKARVTIPFKKPIGEGFSKIGPTYGTSNSAKVILDQNGNPITAFPIWGQ